jgi:hypothetical protein
MVAWFVVSLKLLHTMQVCGDTSFFFSSWKRTQGMASFPPLLSLLSTVEIEVPVHRSAHISSTRMQCSELVSQPAGVKIFGFHVATNRAAERFCPKTCAVALSLTPLSVSASEHTVWLSAAHGHGWGNIPVCCSGSGLRKP